MTGAQESPRSDHLSKYEADELTVKLTLDESLFPDEEDDLTTSHIEMNGEIVKAEIVGSNAEVDLL